MLSSRLISIQNVSKTLVLLFLMASCSSYKEARIQEAVNAAKVDDCQDTDSFGDKKFLMASAIHHSKVLSRCFENFMRFETNKKQTVKTCNILTVRKDGKVTYAYTRGYKGTVLPKDLKMCMEQDFWKMHFKGLQLDKGYTIKFPVGFQSI